MTEVLDQAPSPAPTDSDLGRVVHRVLANSDEPLTLSKIRSHLPTAHRSVSAEDLRLCVERLTEANVFYRYDPYRSQHPRYWDRAMREHIRMLIRKNLEAEPLAWAQLRRKLPSYAQDKAEEVLKDLVAQGFLHEHPRAAARSGIRYGVRPPDAREYLRRELPALFARLEQELRFSQSQLREAAIELLHEEEWASPPAPQPPPAQEAPAALPTSTEGRQAGPPPAPAADVSAPAPAAPEPVPPASRSSVLVEEQPAAPPTPPPDEHPPREPPEPEPPPAPVAEVPPPAPEHDQEQPAAPRSVTPPAEGPPPLPVAPSPPAAPAGEDVP